MGSNIYDVAKAAKVSISTVSRVINNPDVVSSDTRDRVKQAMDTLNFVPNSLARSLTSKNHPDHWSGGRGYHQPLLRRTSTLYPGCGQ